VISKPITVHLYDTIQLSQEQVYTN